jgi:hypothetical protein
MGARWQPGPLAPRSLPSGSGPLQAVRGNFRYSDEASPCSGGDFDDADTLAFAVRTINQ